MNLRMPVIFMCLIPSVENILFLHFVIWDYSLTMDWTSHIVEDIVLCDFEHHLYRASTALKKKSQTLLSLNYKKIWLKMIVKKNLLKRQIFEVFPLTLSGAGPRRWSLVRWAKAVDPVWTSSSSTSSQLCCTVVCFLTPRWALWRKIRQLPALIMLFHSPNASPSSPLVSTPSPPFMINYSVNIIRRLNRNISAGRRNCVSLLMSVDTHSRRWSRRLLPWRLCLPSHKPFVFSKTHTEEQKDTHWNAAL